VLPFIASANAAMNVSEPEFVAIGVENFLLSRMTFVKL